jgi:Spy/CpxP family protein refolding chaperone
MIHRETTLEKEGVTKMKRAKWILLTMVLAGLLAVAGIVIAQEMKEKEETAQPPAMGRGMGRMMERPGMMMRMGRGLMMQPGRMSGRMDMLGRLADRLDLSEEQRDEIKDVLTAHQKYMIQQKADRELAEVELRELTMKDDPDLDAIEEQIKQIASLEAGMRYSQIKAMVDAKSVLTDEQREELKKLTKDRPARMMRRGTGRRGERRGPAGRHR